MIIELILGLAFLILVWKSLKKPDNYPPGLWGVPGFGYIPLPTSKKSYGERLDELRQKHGNVVLWRMGTKLMVFLFDYKMIKEALHKTDFIDRPQNGVLSLLAKENENAGVLISNGEHWQTMRRFTLRIMRDMGMGKSKIVSAIHDEANYMIETIKKTTGTPGPLPHAYYTAVVNIIWQMVASTRYEAGDSTVEHFDKLISDIQSHALQFVIPGFMPWLSKAFPAFIYDRLIRREVMDKTRSEFYQFMQEFIDDHKKNIDYNDQKDFINAYLVEIEKQKDDPNSTMSERDLVVCLVDLFTAGSETTSTTMQWATLYLVNYPEIQKKIQNEVDEQMPKGTLPLLEDKSRLAYVEAFIHELHRHSSFVMNGVMHLAVQDIKLGEYFIPKGAILNPVSTSCHYDPKYWDDPKSFNPDRFLDKDGKFKPISEGFLPFGTGKRQCPGEALARVELFIFLTALVQHFNFSPPPGEDKVDLTPIPHNPFVRIPKDDLNILITLRP